MNGSFRKSEKGVGLLFLQSCVELSARAANHSGGAPVRLGGIWTRGAARRPAPRRSARRTAETLRAFPAARVNSNLYSLRRP